MKRAYHELSGPEKREVADELMLPTSFFGVVLMPPFFCSRFCWGPSPPPNPCQAACSIVSRQCPHSPKTAANCVIPPVGDWISLAPTPKYRPNVRDLALALKSATTRLFARHQSTARLWQTEAASATATQIGDRAHVPIANSR
jgi:hypothetical protein